jgi:hypothetical protein
LSILLFAGQCFAQQTWQVAAKDIETIIIGISFADANNGWVPGDENGVGALFLRSTDGGMTWKPVTHTGYVMLPMGIAMEKLPNGTYQGVISGLGFGKNFTSMEYTADGSSFHPPESDPDFLGEGQDAKVIWGQPSAFALAGQYTSFQGKNYNGLAASFDGGHTWVNYDIGYSYPWARYGHFPSPTTWYISAGVWPGDLNWDYDPEARVLSQYVRIHKRHGIQFRPMMGLHGPSRKPLQASGYMAAISKTTDGGKTWATVYNNTGNFYLNDIDCPTTTDCWAVGESESDSPQPGVRIIHTADGGNTWNVQMYIANASYSLIDIGMINATEGWAVGAILTRTITGQFFHTSDGGNTWTMAQSLSDEYAMAVSFVETVPGMSYLGWASAITLEGKSSILRYA